MARSYFLQAGIGPVGQVNILHGHGIDAVGDVYRLITDPSVCSSDLCGGLRGAGVEQKYFHS
jgi:hypothetical protein